jgi:hypothetical protein
MVWRSGRTCLEDLRAGGSGRWQRGAIFQGQYYHRRLQGTCAAQRDRHRGGIAEKRTSRPRPQFRNRPRNLLADWGEWSKAGRGMNCTSQPTGRLRPRAASRSKEHLLRCPEGVRGCCVYHAAVNPRLGRPIPRAVLDRTVNGNLSPPLSADCGLEAQLGHLLSRDKLLKQYVRL